MDYLDESVRVSGCKHIVGQVYLFLVILNVQILLFLIN